MIEIFNEDSTSLLANARELNVDDVGGLGRQIHLYNVLFFIEPRTMIGAEIVIKASSNGVRALFKSCKFQGTLDLIHDTGYGSWKTDRALAMQPLGADGYFVRPAIAAEYVNVTFRLNVEVYDTPSWLERWR